MTLSETRRYRKFTAQQKLELVMASLRGERSIAELCREHRISESLLRRWRDVALEAAGERLAGGQDRSVAAEQHNRIADLERRWAARPTRPRSWETAFGRGSERARRLRPRAGGGRASPGGRGAHPADQPPGDLPHPQ